MGGIVADARGEGSNHWEKKEAVVHASLGSVTRVTAKGGEDGG
jgi:hypothetical protein